MTSTHYPRVMSPEHGPANGSTDKAQGGKHRSFLSAPIREKPINRALIAVASNDQTTAIQQASCEAVNRLPIYVDARPGGTMALLVRFFGTKRRPQARWTGVTLTETKAEPEEVALDLEVRLYRASICIVMFGEKEEGKPIKATFFQGWEP